MTTLGSEAISPGPGSEMAQPDGGRHGRGSRSGSRVGLRPGRRTHGLRSWYIPLGPVAIASVPLLVQVARVGHSLHWSLPGGSDYAGLELDVRAALRGDLLLGASSRLGVRNLGPVQAYWTAPWYALTGHGIGGMVLAGWLVQLAAVSAAVLVVRSVVGRRAAWFAGVAIGLAWLRASPSALSDFYNPALTIPAAMVGTIAAAALARGRWAILPVAVVAVSIGAQVHFAAGPGLLLIAPIGALIGWRHGRPRRRDVIVSCALFALLWTPTVIDQVHGTGNLSRLVSAVRAGADSPNQPLGQPTKSGPRGDRAQTAAELVAMSTPRAATHGTLAGIAAPLQGPTAVRTLLAVGILTLDLVAAWRSRKRAAFAATILAFGALGATTTYLLTATLDRGFLPYYLAPLPGYGIAMLVGLAVLVAERIRIPAWRGAVIATLTAGVIVCATAFVTIQDADTLTVVDIPSPEDQIRFADRAIDVLPVNCRDRGVALQAAVAQIADVWTLIVAFDKARIPATVPDVLEPLVGPGHHRTGRESVVVIVPTLAEFHKRTVPSGAFFVRGCG